MKKITRISVGQHLSCVLDFAAIQHAIGPMKAYQSNNLDVTLINDKILRNDQHSVRYISPQMTKYEGLD